MTNKIVNQTVLRNSDVKEMLSISQSTLDRLVNSGKLKKIKIADRAVGYMLNDVQNYISECQEGANGE